MDGVGNVRGARVAPVRGKDPVLHLVGPDDGCGDLSIFRVGLQSGESSEQHYHHLSDELLIIIGGRCRVRIGVDGKNDCILGNGDTFFVSRRTPHVIDALDDDGRGADLDLFIIMAPALAMDEYPL